MKVWAKTKEFSEGKYLVVRRDGTIPPWPHFVIGADDPNAPAALRAYATQAFDNGLDPEYTASIREMASEWENRDKTHSKADPDAPPHRKDNPAIIELMRGNGDLSNFRQWQPIETAPKDGREVILRVAMRGGIPGKSLVGHYQRGGHCIEDHPPIDAGWYFWDGRMFDLAAKPTHWMPLPDEEKV